MYSALILAGLCGCDGPTAELVEWTAARAEDPSGAFLSAWGSSPEDVWVVGGQPETGTILRGSGSSWTVQDVPEGTPLLNWVHGTSASNVWVGGLGGTVLQWDGSEWIDRSLPTDAAVWGLYVRSAEEVVVVGGTSAWGGEAALAERWNGSEWEALELPAEVAGIPSLFKVAHDGATLWMVGAGGSAVRSEDGTTLTAVPTGYSGDLVTVADAGGYPIIVGGRGTGVVFEEGSGSLEKTNQAPAGLAGVASLGDGTALVVGEYGYTGLYDTSDQSLVELEGTDTRHVLHGAYVAADGRLYAVGGNLYTADDRFVGSIWVGE